MDVFSHGLWGWIAFGRQARFGLTVTFGMLPDLLAFGHFFMIKTVTQGFGHFNAGRPLLEIFHQWVFTVYNLSHSLVVAGFLFAVMWYTGTGGWRWRSWPGPCIYFLIYPPTPQPTSPPSFCIP